MSAEHDHLPDAPQDYATQVLMDLLRAVWRDPATPEGVVPYRFDDIDGTPALEHTADLLADISSERLRLVAAAARALNEAAMLAHLRRMHLGPFPSSDEDPADREFPTIPSPGDLPDYEAPAEDDAAVDSIVRMLDIQRQVGMLAQPPLRDRLNGFIPGAGWLSVEEADRLAAGIHPHPFWLPDGYYSPGCMQMVDRDGGGDQCGLPAAHPIHDDPYEGQDFDYDGRQQP